MGDSGEKTFDPTPRQLRRARERGEVAQSRDLTSAMALTVGLVVLGGHAGAIVTLLETTMRDCFTIATTRELGVGLMLDVLGRAVLAGMAAIMPGILAMMVVGAFVSFVQTGGLLTFQTLMPKLSKVNPLAGMKKIFLSGSTYIELLKTAFKAMIVGWVCWGIISGSFGIILRLGACPPRVILQQAGALVWTCVIRVVLCYIAIAALDVLYQRWHHIKQLRMTRQEVTEESKEEQGNPQHRSERKRLHEEIASENMLQQVRKASVIVTNPDHLACALRYDPEQEGSPRLLAKGQGYMAERIKQIAKEEGIPIERDVSLAHALYQMQLDEQIPEELYEIVGELLRWVEVLAKAEGKVPLWRQPREQAEASD